MNKDLKILVTGVNGQLGYDCLRILKKRGYKNVVGIDINDVDITNEKQVNKYFLAYNPDIILHNAAWTAVDKAEENKEEVYKVNALGTKYIAQVARQINAKMVYISTDYVFGGDGDKFFDVNDKINPQSIYGKTKADGENFVKKIVKKYFIIRISWVFGINGNNFIKTMIKLADNNKKEVSVVNDQIGSPTYTLDLAKFICDLIETEKYGVYHATNEGVCSWADFAEYIFQTINSDTKVKRVTTQEYNQLMPGQAKRPLNSRMSKQSLVNAGFHKFPKWKTSVSNYIKKELKR